MLLSVKAMIQMGVISATVYVFVSRIQFFFFVHAKKCVQALKLWTRTLLLACGGATIEQGSFTQSSIMTAS